MVDALGNPVAFSLTPGQACDLSQAEPLLETVEPQAFLADKAYDADALIQTLHARRITPVTPPKANRRQPRQTDFALYRERNLIERFFNKHLIEISATVSPGAVALLIMDGAGWHRSNQLVVPNNIVLLKLPPYAPELNPTENIWQYLRANALANSVWESYESHCRGLLQRLERPHRQAGGHHLHRNPPMGAGQYLGRLVS